jgi:hypothetical protein
MARVHAVIRRVAHDRAAGDPAWCCVMSSRPDCHASVDQGPTERAMVASGSRPPARNAHRRSRRAVRCGPVGRELVSQSAGRRPTRGAVSQARTVIDDGRYEIEAVRDVEWPKDCTLCPAECMRTKSYSAATLSTRTEVSGVACVLSAASPCLSCLTVSTAAAYRSSSGSAESSSDRSESFTDT